MSLALLAVPTALLAVAPDLTTFTALRIVQGLCMSTAFALTLSYLGEQCSAADAAGAFAAYITGNVASNLFGRLMSAALVDHLGLAANFYVFAALNLAGAVLVWFYARPDQPMAADGARRPRRRCRSGPSISRNGAAARELRHRLLHPVRLHRHLHLRELRAGARAALASA